MPPYENDPFTSPSSEPVNPASNAGGDSEQAQLLKDLQLTQTFPSPDGKIFAVTTALDKTYRGWSFRSYVTLNGKETDGLEYPKLTPEGGFDPQKNDVPPESFVNKVIQKHHTKCQVVQALLAQKVAETKGKKFRGRLLLASWLVMMAAIGGGGYYFLRLRPLVFTQQIQAIAGEAFTAGLAAPAGVTMTLTSSPPDWLNVDAQALTLNGTPPAGTQGSYPLTFETRDASGRTGTLTVALHVATPLIAPQVTLDFSSIRGTIEPDANGIPTLKLQKTDMITVTVRDAQTGKTLVQELINIQLVE